MDLKREFQLQYKLMFISQNLKIHDMISVIFLICDKRSTGLKIMELLLNADSHALQIKAFFKWAKKQLLFSCSDWPERLGHVLRVIQNYKLSSYLGYDKAQSNVSEKASDCSELRIVLYKLCESLNAADTKTFINSVERDKNIGSLPNDVKNKYLEYKILEWSDKNIISMDVNALNMEVILKNLKPLKADNIISEIKVIVERAGFNMIKNIRTLQLQNNLPEFYNIINKNDVGLCVIINEKLFQQSDFKPRWGSNRDVERLKEVFTAYGFRTETHTDVRFTDLMRLLNQHAKLISKNDSFFVLIILSHGSENVIYTSDSVPVSMDSIEMIFQADNCPNLIGKPKIFIVQSCQGEKWQRILHRDDEHESAECEIESDAAHNLVQDHNVRVKGPEKGDSIIAWSTVKGYASFRDKYNGSWYIEEFCKELWKFGQIADLVDILTLVNNNLRSKVYDGQFMVPSLLSSLSCKIQFPFVEQNWLRGRQMMLKRLFFENYFVEFLQNSSDKQLNSLTKKFKM